MMLFHARQAKIKAAKTERQAAMVDAQQMQNCRLQVVDVHRIFRNMKPQLVGLTQR